MKRKILSLMLICFVILSTCAVVVSADTLPEFKLVATKVDADDYNLNGYYKVDVVIVSLPYTEPVDGFDAFQYNIEFDSSKFDYGYTVAKKTPAGVTTSTKYTADGEIYAFDEGWGVTSGVVSIGVPELQSSGNVVKTATNVTAGYKVTAYKNADYDLVDNSVLGTYYFSVKDNAYGDATFNLKEGVFGVGANAEKQVSGTHFTFTGTTVNLGEAPVDPTPVATAVKTFAKRLYLDNTLYTVGVITEGDDYVAADVKAGINIVKGEGTVNYWTNNAPVSDDNGTSYFVVALTDITEDTEITADSASKALLVVGSETLEGAAVSANSTSVDDKVE